MSDTHHIDEVEHVIEEEITDTDASVGVWAHPDVFWELQKLIKKHEVMLKNLGIEKEVPIAPILLELQEAIVDSQESARSDLEEDDEPF